MRINDIFTATYSLGSDPLAFLRSVTHVALGTTRVMRTCGMMGEVVGMAASICRRRSCRPRGVYTDHLGELKALMTKGVGTGAPQPPQDYNLGAMREKR